jgi:GDPmannose 4,6-dehydratase
MWLMLQQDEPDNYVCATGASHTIQQLVDYTFGVLGVDTNLVKTSAKFERPEELEHLKGDSTKLRTKLGWEPTYTFETMLDEMIFVAANKINKDVDTRRF